MSTGPMVSTAQIAAQLDTVLQRDPDAVVVAIRAAIKGPWPDGLERRGRRFHLRWCESRLSIREALTEIEVPEDQKNKVIETLEKGYYLADRIIRFAKVVVGK